MDPAELTRRIQEATPFVKLLGIEVLEAGDDRATLRLVLRPELTQDLGYAHGGVVGTLADIAANTAWREPSVTVEYKVNFLTGAKGRSLIARAVLIRKGRTLSVAESRVYGVDAENAETLAAVCTATLAPIRR